MEPQSQSTHLDPGCRQKLSNALSQFSADKVSDQLLPLSRPVSFTAGEHLLEAGETADSVFFLCTGLVRFYYLTEDGREHNKSFAGAGIQTKGQSR